MGLLSTAMKAYLDAGGKAIGVFEFDLDGTTYRFASHPLSSVTYGPMAARVVSWSVFTNSFSIVSSSLQSPTGTLVLEDKRQVVSPLIASRSDKLKNAPARVRCAGDTVEPADWFTQFEGLIDKVSYSDYKWQIRLRTDDEPLKGDLGLPYITPEIFTTAEESSIGTPVPLVLGKHDSTAFSVLGMLPTWHCSTDGDPEDTTYGHRYLISAGAMNALPEFWVDGVSGGAPAAPNEAWFWTKRAGRTFTELGFAAGQGDAVITVDAWGMSTNGEGSTTAADLITNPVSQLALVLSNFGFNKWRTGAWYDYYDDAPIGEQSFADARGWVAAKGHKGSISLARKVTERMLNDWCKQHQIAIRWNESGKLDLIVNDPHTHDVYLDDNTPANTPWIKNRELLSRPKIVYDVSSLYDAISSRYVYATSESDYKKSMSAIDWARGYDSADSLDIEWGDASGN